MFNSSIAFSKSSSSCERTGVLTSSLISSKEDLGFTHKLYYYKEASGLVYSSLSNVRFLRLENVPTINAFGVLKEAYNTKGQQLKDIRLVGFTYDGDVTDLDMIANLATDKDKDGNDFFIEGSYKECSPGRLYDCEGNFLEEKDCWELFLEERGVKKGYTAVLIHIASYCNE